MIQKFIILLFIFTFSITLTAQNNKRYRIVENWNGEQSVYTIINRNGDTIKTLDPDKYITTLQPAFDNFAILSIKGRPGWSAIDLDENYLFQVFNRYPSEPFPDYLVENRIRIVGENDLIGFADSTGKIMIEPRFQIISEFNNGFAVFKSECKRVHNGQEGEHAGFSLRCEKVGYIDKDGKVIEIGNFSADQLKERIGWKGEY